MEDPDQAASELIWCLSVFLAVVNILGYLPYFICSKWAFSNQQRESMSMILSVIEYSWYQKKIEIFLLQTLVLFH